MGVTKAASQCQGLEPEPGRDSESNGVEPATLSWTGMPLIVAALLQLFGRDSTLTQELFGSGCALICLRLRAESIQVTTLQRFGLEGFSSIDDIYHCQ